MTTIAIERIKEMKRQRKELLTAVSDRPNGAT